MQGQQVDIAERSRNRIRKARYRDIKSIKSKAAQANALAHCQGTVVQGRA